MISENENVNYRTLQS